MYNGKIFTGCHADEAPQAGVDTMEDLGIGSIYLRPEPEYLRGGDMIKVLFVCLGIFVVLPLLMAMFESLKDNKPEKFIFVDSVGTASSRKPKSPDSRAQQPESGN